MLCCLWKEVVQLAETSNFPACVEPEIAERAEQVLGRLGIPLSNAIGMFLRQVVLQHGIPFEMKLPQEVPLAYGSFAREQFDAEIEKGVEDMREGRVYPWEAVEEEMKRDYGI